MNDAALPPGYLGPATEARFAEAFAHSSILSKKAAAALIGLDEKTLDAASDAKIIRAVRKGAHRAYTERDLRAYLLEGPDVPCAPSAPKLKARAAAGANVRLVNFSERRKRRLNEHD